MPVHDNPKSVKCDRNTFRRLTTATPPLIRFIVGIGILLAFLTSFILFSTQWTNGDIADTTKSITIQRTEHLVGVNGTNITTIESTQYLVGANGTKETFYHYPNSHASRRHVYDKDTREKQISLRVRFTPMIYSESTMIEENSVYVTEVGDDLLLWTILLSLWFIILWLLSLLRTIVNVTGWGESHEGSFVAPILNFITAFEDVDAAEDFIDWAFDESTALKALKALKVDSSKGGKECHWVVTHMKTMLRITCRALFSFVREGFFVVATAVIVTYMYITLQAFEGKCGDNNKNCMVQHSAYKQIDAFVVFSVVFVGRMLSGYNYKDADIDSNPDDNVDIIGALKKKKWRTAIDEAVTTAEKRIASTTVQSIACFGSIACSIATLWLLGASFRTIDPSRRHPWDAIIVFIIILEVTYICLNAIVFLLSSTVSLDIMFSKMKLYVEGKLFGALYFTCGAITIYMCSRMAVNMYGSAYWNPQNLDLNWIQVKQLSPKTSHCHFIPKHVYNNHEKYNFYPRQCELRGDCCTQTELHRKDNDSCGNECMPNEHTTYTGLIVASLAVGAQVLLGLIMLVWGRNPDIDDPINKGLHDIAQSGLDAITDRKHSKDDTEFRTIRVV